MSTISIDVIFNAVNKAMPAINKIDQGMNRINSNLWRVNQATEAWQKTAQTIDQVSQPFRGYNEGLAELESITGITGKDLEGLGKNARKVGKDAGVGASGAIEAYKLLASQIDVTKIGMGGLNVLQAKTITLSQASKMSMANSANALAGTLNQFGYEADQAGRVMNVLAAGSKYGAAEIPELAQSFKVVGTAAAAAGLNVETTGGAIETLSKANLKGSEAGTALRNVLTSMQTKLGFDFKVTKLSDALKTLEGREGDAAYMSKIFGQENIAAAGFLIKNANMVDEMTARMTDTSVATEQAAINNKTFNHWIDVQRSKMNDLSIAFFQHNEGLLKGISLTGQVAAGMTSMLPLVGGVGKAFTGGVIGIAKTAKATKLMSAAMKAGKMGTYAELVARYGMAGKMAAVGIKISTLAQGAWNAVAGFTTATMVPLIASTWAWTAALLANPVTWIVVGVGALVAGLIAAWKHFDKFRGVVVGAWEGLKGFGKVLFQSVLDPIKQILSGIGKLGKAIGLLFKGKFSAAWDTAKEGMTDMAVGAVKATPIGVVTQVVSRRQEIIDKAAAGYEKGKAIDTSKEGRQQRREERRLRRNGVDPQTLAAAPPRYNYTLPEQGLLSNPLVQPPVVRGALPQQPTMNVVKAPGMVSPLTLPQPKQVQVPGNVVMNQPQPNPVTIPGTINAQQPTMQVVKAPGMVSPLTLSQPKQVQVPGNVAMNQPQPNPVTIPGTINAQQPTMQVVKAPGMVSPLSLPQPNQVQVPGNLAMNQPKVNPVTVPGQMAMNQPPVSPVTIPGTIKANQPKVDPVDIPGNVVLNVQKIAALNFLGNLSFQKPEPIKKQAAAESVNSLEMLTRNITTNIQQTENYNRTENRNQESNNAKIEVTYSPQITISSALDQRAKDDLMTMLEANKDELMKLINEELRRSNRLSYAG